MCQVFSELQQLPSLYLECSFSFTAAKEPHSCCLYGFIPNVEDPGNLSWPLCFSVKSVIFELHFPKTGLCVSFLITYQYENISYRFMNYMANYTSDTLQRNICEDKIHSSTISTDLTSVSQTVPGTAHPKCLWDEDNKWMENPCYWAYEIRQVSMLLAIKLQLNLLPGHGLIFYWGVAN